jgi:hypothetical protein
LHRSESIAFAGVGVHARQASGRSLSDPPL